MSYAALYKHLTLLAVTIYSYVHTSPMHIFLHQMYRNAMRTISTPDQFTHMLHQQSRVLLHQDTTFKEPNV